MSHKDKKQISKALKKVAFFSLKHESVVEAHDLDSEGMEEAEDVNLGAINKSIQKGFGGMRRNPKSFNFSQKQMNDFIDTENDIMMTAEKTPVLRNEK